MFGAKIKKLRIEKKISLRKFCDSIGHDPSNWSKIERGVLKPSRNLDIKKIASIFGITQKDPFYTDLMLSAEITSGEIPAKAQKDNKIMELLPGFFRKLIDPKDRDKKIMEVSNFIDNT